LRLLVSHKLVILRQSKNIHTGSAVLLLSIDLAQSRHSVPMQRLLTFSLGLVHLLVLRSGISLRSEVGGGAAGAGEESGEDRLDD